VHKIRNDFLLGLREMVLLDDLQYMFKVYSLSTGSYTKSKSNKNDNYSKN